MKPSHRRVRLRAFIQARMSSRRFPGKVLAPFMGRPVLDRVVAAVSAAVPRAAIVVLTSREPSDDPVADYARGLGVKVFRGPLDDVFGRFRLCLEKNPCDWFFRICADSPLLDPRIVKAMACLAGGAADLVTNVFPRTFPKGQSAELLRAETFRRIACEGLSSFEREHVTPVYYANPGDYTILNLFSGGSAWKGLHMDVSTPGDLDRLAKRYGAGRRPRWRFRIGPGRRHGARQGRAR